MKWKKNVLLINSIWIVIWNEKKTVLSFTLVCCCCCCLNQWADYYTKKTNPSQQLMEACRLIAARWDFFSTHKKKRRLKTHWKIYDRMIDWTKLLKIDQICSIIYISISMMIILLYWIETAKKKHIYKEAKNEKKWFQLKL